MFLDNLSVEVVFIRAFHTLTEREAIVKRFNNSKDSLQVLISSV